MIMVFYGLIPTFLLIGILIALFFFQKHMKTNALKKGVFIYLTVLLIAAIGVHLIPSTSFTSLEDLSQNRNATADYNTFNDAINSGTLNNHDKFIIKKQWEYTVTADELELIYAEPSSPIFVVRTDMGDNQIEVFHYSSKTSFGSAEITEQKNAFNIYFHNTRLIIENPKEFTYEISGFKKDFVVTQFKGNSFFGGAYFIPISNKSFEAIVIRVPKDLKLSSNSNFQLIMKDE
jgi:hypothetical protein